MWLEMACIPGSPAIWNFTNVAVFWWTSVTIVIIKWISSGRKLGRGRGVTYRTINVTSVRERGSHQTNPFLPFWPTLVNHIFAILKPFEGRYRKLPRGQISGADIELSIETKISKKYWFVTELHRLQRNRKQRFRDWELYHFAEPSRYRQLSTRSSVCDSAVGGVTLSQINIFD